ncbi:MAG: RNA ligase [Caldimicrobium sp.]|nr:RNA ligase [Caldimicrobium sp.]MCX7873724.1 RNA ligase [Caldimicrobium sp.]MDW8093648.1 RNA ligase [Caldimicrobium sp.]
MKEDKEVLEILSFFWDRNPFLKVLPIEDWEKAYASGKLIFFTWKEHQFFRLNKEFKNYPVGTFFNDTLLVKGYPSIPRIYVLQTGLKRYLQYPFYAEEKIEGYNVRLVKVGHDILAFTRRGYVCPFATDRWEEFLPRAPEFWREFPDYIICCEVAGPENPFVSEWPPQVKEDIQYFVFDFAKIGTGEFLPTSQKRILLQKYQLTHPEIHGPFDPEVDYQKIKFLLKRYHEEGREGVVFKPEKEGSRVKYVTPYSNLNDLKVVFPYLGEVEPNYISLRLIRLALNLLEFEEYKDEVYKVLGNYLFEETLRLLKKKEILEEFFQVRFKREENFNALLAHFKLARVNVEILEKDWKEGYLVVRFKKIYPRATQFWGHKLEGWGEID